MTTFDNFWALLNFIFFLRRQRFFTALLMASNTVPIQRLFISANFWWFLALLKVLLFFGGNVVFRHCWALVQQRRKESCSKRPTFDDFKHCLFFFVFRMQFCASAQLRGTIVPKKSVQQCQFLMLFGTVELFLFSGGNVILRRFWWLVLQCRNKGCSLVPIFDDYWHSWKFFFLFGGNFVLQHFWALLHRCRKECYSTMTTFDSFWALLNIIFFYIGNFILRLCWWLELQCRNKGCSLVPIFDVNWLCWKFGGNVECFCFGGNVVLRHCWGLLHRRVALLNGFFSGTVVLDFNSAEVQQCRRKIKQQCQ